MRKCIITGATENLKDFIIDGRGYGSMFDCDSFTLTVCEEYAKLLKEEWFDEKPVVVDYVEHYQYEKEIENFIDTYLPNPESFWDMTDEAFNQNFSEMLSKLETRECKGIANKELEEAYKGIDLEAAFTMD